MQRAAGSREKRQATKRDKNGAKATWAETMSLSSRSYRIRVKSWNGTGPVLAEALPPAQEEEEDEDDEAEEQTAAAELELKLELELCCLQARKKFHTNWHKYQVSQRGESAWDWPATTLTDWRTDCMTDIEHWAKEKSHNTNISMYMSVCVWVHREATLLADEIFTLAIINRLPLDIISMLELCCDVVAARLSLFCFLFYYLFIAGFLFLCVLFLSWFSPLVGRVQCWNAHRTNWNCCDNNKNSSLEPLFAGWVRASGWSWRCQLNWLTIRRG